MGMFQNMVDYLDDMVEVETSVATTRLFLNL